MAIDKERFKKLTGRLVRVGTATHKRVAKPSLPKMYTRKGATRQGKRVKKEKKSVGRPKGSYKRGMPATEYYKLVRAQKRRARMAAEQAQARYQAAMIARGMPQMQQMPVQTAQMPPQAPQRAPVRRLPVSQYQYPQRRPIQRNIQPQQQFKVVTDIMTGKKIIKQLPPREKWTYD